MPSEYAKSLGARLRSIRQQQGLSLQGVEEKSNGRWKAVVVGSYERGDRAISVAKLAASGRTEAVAIAAAMAEATEASDDSAIRPRTGCPSRRAPGRPSRGVP